MRHSIRKEIRRFLCFLMTFIMILTSMPVHLLAANVDHNNLSNNKSEIINNKTPVTVAKPEEGKTAKDLIKNPDQPDIYTLRTDFKVQRGEKYEVDYQPYIASVGAAATEEEKAKVKKTIKLPDLAGYEKPDDDYLITYDKVKNAGNNGSQEFRYKAKPNQITIKHVFQDLHDFTKYTNPDGSIGERGQLITTQNGNTGSTMEVSPLNENDPRRKGFVPEAESINMQVPENAENFVLEYRYNRAHYDVNFDTKGGTPVPDRNLYYEQIIPTIDDKSIPTKAGCDFLGWMPSITLETTGGKTYPENQIIKDSTGKPILNLAADLKMPASKITFTAVWKDKPKAEYVIQFWTEKTDYDDKDDKLPLRNRYDFVGARRIDDANTGSTPDLTNLDIHGITFPDLNDGRLEKAQDDKKEFERYYFLNEELTKKQNASKDNPEVQKSVLSTGETVYNVYYNRRVYTLYFTSNNFYDEWAYWPIITRDGKVLGKEGSPYKVNARFNQSLDKIWPKDEEVSGLPMNHTSDPSGDDGLIGWMINHNGEDWVQIFRDTPPYRLSAEDFIDAEDVMGTDKDHGNGHADEIPIADGETKKRDKYEISLGASYMETAVVHHVDIIKDDFEGNEQIDYDMTYWKSDTNAVDYPFILPHLQGFTLKEETRPAKWIGKIKRGDVEKTFDELNEQRNAKTPFRSDADKIKYIPKFPWGTKSFNGVNAYNYANYTRNKYKLKLNNDPKTVKNDSEYGEGNILDVPYDLPLNDLKLDTTHKPEKPNWVRNDWSFLGWALDPAGDNLVKDGNETKFHYDQILYAKWGEPDYKWKVTFDPNGGSLRTIDENKLTTERKTVKEGDIGQEKETTYPIKEKSEGDKQVFKVVHKQKLVEPSFKPVRKGYDFMGWEIIRYKKDATTGDYTDVIDTSYRDTYKVPELYSFGNDVVSPIYLKAIWVPNARVDVKVEHYMLDKDYKLVKKLEDTLEDKRANYLVATTGDKQDDEYILAPHEELEEKLTGDLKKTYEEYNKRVKGDNTFFQQFRVEPAQILNTETNKLEDNPKVKDNVFKFFYRPFRQREYKVNYIDERFKGNETAEGAAIIDQEPVSNGNRHFDARNYRPIPGWKLVSAPQQQLFFDVDEDTNAFKGINGTGKNEITFYYKDVRVIEIKDPKEKVPEGYVRVTFKADKGGSFTDKDGNSKTELYYDVIKGLKSDLLPVPKELAEGETVDKDKHYITPEPGKKFIKWDDRALLNDNTIISDPYTFTAYFDWKEIKINPLVITEAYTDPNGKWTNDFAPTVDKLKGQVKWYKNKVEEDLPAGVEVIFADDIKTTLAEKFKELGKSDKDELVREVKIPAKIKYADNSIQDIEIPVKVYKNVYEALNEKGDKPLFLKEAEGKEAKDGGLKEILKDNTENRYIKVTIKPNKDFKNKDDKVYYVNPNAWVEIPEVETTGDSTFTNWTADNKEVNEEQKENGVFDFNKRHKFTEDTIITPVGAGDVVEQKKEKINQKFQKITSK
ncbi:InlB B-repeat-containing protein [Finegoldia magna]|uniref:InlB B-repeat-containing protein n=1 Tax=Finegoldia magna TaxID=1260 RepID=UPI001F4FE5E4|nr:InlB B-repeat-containing protein [Finegoldia magna]